MNPTGLTHMRNPVTVLSTLLSVEVVLYTMSLCSPQWLVEVGGASQGLFSLCSSYHGFSSCATFPAWLGPYSLSWMFLSLSSLSSLLTLVFVRPALNSGKKAVSALLMNITSVIFCACCLISFLTSVAQVEPDLLKHLGWTFYICCSTLVYAAAVSVLLSVVRGDSVRVEPDVRGAAVDVSVIAA